MGSRGNPGGHAPSPPLINTGNGPRPGGPFDPERASPLNSGVPTPLIDRDSMSAGMCRVDCLVRLAAAGAITHAGSEGFESALLRKGVDQAAHLVAGVAKIALVRDAYLMYRCVADTCTRKETMCLPSK